MSTDFGKVVSLILLERFGETTEKVGSVLFKRGPVPLLYIKSFSKLNTNMIEKVLCLLIRHGLVIFKPDPKNPTKALYSLESNKVLLMLRYPKYIRLIKKKFGHEAEIILEQVMEKGHNTASNLVLKTFERLNKDSDKTFTLKQIKEKLNSLIIAKYLKRTPKPKDENPVPILEPDVTQENVMPSLDLKILTLIQSGQTDLSSGDEKIRFEINFDRFHQDMRDQLIVDVIGNKFGKNAGELIRIFLQQMYIRTDPWADVSNPIPIIEVKDLVKKLNTHPQLVAFFEQYLNILETDSSKIIMKAGEASGGSFQIFMKEIFTLLAWEAVEQVVLEKFDVKAARIFRLVKSKKYIEPDQLQQLAMIPAKEAKKLSYQLLEENFLQIQEFKKAVSSNGPNKCFTLFHIELHQVVRMVLELCYKSLVNVMMRRNHDKYENKRNIDKKQRIDMISFSMKLQGASEEQLADIEDMLTPPEREILEKIDKTLKKLNASEIEIDETLFLLEIYLAYE